MRLRAIVRPRRALTWLARAGVALSLPTLGAGLIGATSLITMMAGLALTRTLGLDPNWFDAGIGAGIVVGLATAVAVGRNAAQWWSAAGRLRADTGTLAIGADGVRWSEGANERFVAWSRVERVDEDPTVEDELGTLVLVCHDEPPIRLLVEDSDELARDARRALEVYRETATEGVLDLEPNGRDLATWIADVRRLLGSGSYRAGAVSADRLIAIASAATAPATQRVGAAVSLASASDEHRTKVRVALTDTADAELRDVLEDAIEGRALDTRAVARAIRDR